ALVLPAQTVVEGQVGAHVPTVGGVKAKVGLVVAVHPGRAGDEGALGGIEGDIRVVAGDVARDQAVEVAGVAQVVGRDVRKIGGVELGLDGLEAAHAHAHGGDHIAGIEIGETSPAGEIG